MKKTLIFIHVIIILLLLSACKNGNVNIEKRIKETSEKTIEHAAKSIEETKQKQEQLKIQADNQLGIVDNPKITVHIEENSEEKK